MYPVPSDKLRQVARDILDAKVVQAGYDMQLQEPAKNRYRQHTTLAKFIGNKDKIEGVDEGSDIPFVCAFRPILDEWERRSLAHPGEYVYVPVAHGDELRHYCTSDITGILRGVYRHIIPEKSPHDMIKSLLNDCSFTRIAVASYGKAVPYAQLLDKLVIPKDYEILAISPDIIDANRATRKSMEELSEMCEVIYDERKQGDTPLFSFSELDTCHPKVHRTDGKPVPDEIIAEKMMSSASLEISDISVHIARLLGEPDVIDKARGLYSALCFTPHDTDGFVSYVTEMEKIPVRYSQDRTAAYSAAGAVSVEMLPDAARDFIYRTRLFGQIWKAFATDGAMDLPALRALVNAPRDARREAAEELYRKMELDALLEAIADGVPLEDLLA